MKQISKKLACGLLTGLLGLAAHATSDTAATEQVQAKLVASVNGVHAGERIVFGLQQKIAAGWHTYWLNPGDTGKPTRIRWTLPAGASAGAIQWPTPQRFQMGDITNFGYANAVTLLTAIDVPKDLPVGSPFEVQAEADWLVCSESCIPQKVSLALTLPVLAPGVASAAGSPLIDQAKAQLPLPSPLPVQLVYGANSVSLRVDKSLVGAIEELDFFPAQAGQIANDIAPTRRTEGQTLVLQLANGEEPASAATPLSGLLVSHSASTTRGYAVNLAGSELAAPGPAATPPAATAEVPPALAAALGLALLGGLVLNLMPCVFPVLSIKALSLLQYADRPARESRLHGWAYTLGALLSFALLGVVLLALKQGGAQIGWGFQYQSPSFVLVSAYVMFAVGLNLSGVFSLQLSAAGWGSTLAARKGYSGSFFTGVLAAVVASPCTAPFMGAAIGYALTQSAAVLLAILLALGFGLALPYLLLSHWPGLQRRLPRPGRWMELLKQGLAFPMYAASVWLVWVLAQQAGANAAAAALGGMVLIAFAAWSFEAARGRGSRLLQRGVASVAVLAIAGALVCGQAGLTLQPAATSNVSSAPGDGWQAYSAQELQNLRKQGKPVFIDLGAAWCVSCLVNEKVALAHSDVRQAFTCAGIHLLKGDWTNEDPQITAKLAEFGRSGVPLYLYYPAGATDPVVLPQILTPQTVLDSVQTTPAGNCVTPQAHAQQTQATPPAAYPAAPRQAV